jgi:hypothetical protein
MVLDPSENFVRGSTDTSVASGDTTLSVVDASIFPDPTSVGDYNAVLWDADQFPEPYEDANAEIVRVTAVDTTNDDLTVTRGQENTTAASHPSGAAIQMSATAKMFSDIENTFSQFWDSTNQELTADVNNAVVSTDDATVNNSLTDASGTSHTGELADSTDVSSIQSSSDVDHDSTTGGTAGNPHSGSASDNHDNTAHSLTFVDEGDGTSRTIWVINNGASDPAGADSNDLIFERE